MELLDDERIKKVREMARSGDAPSTMLRMIISALPSAREDQILVVRYFAAAFYFKDGQAHPIHGWFPVDSGQLEDSDVDRIMLRRMEQTREEWGRSSEVGV